MYVVLGTERNAFPFAELVFLAPEYMFRFTHFLLFLFRRARVCVCMFLGVEPASFAVDEIGKTHYRAEGGVYILHTYCLTINSTRSRASERTSGRAHAHTSTHFGCDGYIIVLLRYGCQHL